MVARQAEPGSALARYYVIDPHLTPYWGYYGAMWLLSRALPLELANRLLFTAYAVGLPLASSFLLASFGRDRRWAVLALPLVFHTNLFMGFATFLLSIPLFLLALGLVERHLAAERLRPGTAAALAAACALVFLFHAQTYLLLGPCVLILLLAHARGAGWLAARAAPFLPSLLLFADWSWRSFVASDRLQVEEHTRSHRTYGGLSGLGAVWEPWREVLGKLPERLFGSFSDGSDRWIGAALLAVFLVALASGWGQAPLAGSTSGVPGMPYPRSRGESTLRAFLCRRRCDLLFLALLASYLFLPMEISGQWYLNPRHLVFAALAAPLLLARPAAGWRRALVAAGAALALLACANAGLKIRAFQAEVGPFEEIAAELPPGGRVLGLPFDLGSGGAVRLWPFVHWACWHQVLAGGDVGFSFAGLPSIPVRYRPGMQAPHPYEWRPEAFDWAAMGRHYDAFLVSGEPRGRGGAELRRNAEPVARAGPFTLWKPRDRLTGPRPSSREAPP